MGESEWERGERDGEGGRGVGGRVESSVQYVMRCDVTYDTIYCIAFRLYTWERG